MAPSSGGRNAAPYGRGEPFGAAEADIDTAALAKATRRAQRAEAELAKTRMALEIMGKAHALLEMLAESADSDSKPKN